MTTPATQKKRRKSSKRSAMAGEGEGDGAVLAIPENSETLPKNATETASTPITTEAEGTDGEGDCIICLENIKVRGQIDSCLHQFCFDCIIKWSKVTNTCPVCKRSFLKVTEVHTSENLPTTSSGKAKKKKKPKVVKIKPKAQRIEAPPMAIPDVYAYDIRALFLHLTAMMWADEEDDSDYVDGEDLEDDLPWELHHHFPVPPTVNLNDIYENGRHVIEILDDDEDDDDWLPPNSYFFDDDGEVEILPTPPSSRRGPRGESLFGPVGSSSYRAAPSSSASGSSQERIPPRNAPTSSSRSTALPAPAPRRREATQHTTRESNSRAASSSSRQTHTSDRQTHPSGGSLRPASSLSSQRGELNSLPTALPRTVSEPNPTLRAQRGEETEPVIAENSSKRKRSMVKKTSSSDRKKAPRMSTNNVVHVDEEEEEEFDETPRVRRKMQRMSTLEDTEDEDELEEEGGGKGGWLRRRRG